MSICFEKKKKKKTKKSCVRELTKQKYPFKANYTVYLFIFFHELHKIVGKQRFIFVDQNTSSFNRQPFIYICTKSSKMWPNKFSGRDTKKEEEQEEEVKNVRFSVEIKMSFRSEAVA